ncbi:MAG: FAD-binding oxidoreductase [Pseudomonadales bacterium]|nr:FAD-binding oxidoreductase [Pseudomonadales bacterium]
MNQHARSDRPAAESASALHIDSYYAATANRQTLRPALEGDQDADVCVVGGGFSGLSTALALAERGVGVRLLEAQAIGFGASGRNGGQVVNGLNASLPKIQRQFGAEMADFVGGLVQEGGRIIRSRIERYGIDCDWRPGNLFAAYTAAHMRELEAKQTLWRRYGMDEHELLDRSAIQRHVASEAYCGGMIDHSGGHLHPLNLALGEADAIESHGGVIHEGSAVTRLERDGDRLRVHTRAGSVRARELVLCGNAYLSGVMPELEWRVMPVSTQVVATEPLGEARARALLPTDLCVEDVRYILDYFRLSADHRLLFGGGTVYGGSDPADVRAKLRPNLERVFPQLAGVRLDYAWSGNFALSFSRVPQLGRLANGAWFAHGYSGHGVTGSHLFGVILAEAITGDRSRFDRFAALRYLPFPGGRRLRVPYSTLGAWWYGLRDRLGV